MDEGYIFVRMQAEPSYGTSIDEGFFVRQKLFEKYEGGFRHLAETFCWYERAGKHSETMVDHTSYTVVTEENLYDLSMVDSMDYIDEYMQEYDLSEDELEELAQDQKIRVQPKEMVTITKERYEKLLEIERAYQFVMDVLDTDQN